MGGGCPLTPSNLCICMPLALSYFSNSFYFHRLLLTLMRTLHYWTEWNHKLANRMMVNFKIIWTAKITKLKPCQNKLFIWKYKYLQKIPLPLNTDYDKNKIPFVSSNLADLWYMYDYNCIFSTLHVYQILVYKG